MIFVRQKGFQVDITAARTKVYVLIHFGIPVTLYILPSLLLSDWGRILVYPVRVIVVFKRCLKIASPEPASEAGAIKRAVARFTCQVTCSLKIHEVVPRTFVPAQKVTFG